VLRNSENQAVAVASATADVDLPPDVDLHARPAATFVRTAMGFAADVSVAVGDRAVRAKSLLSILALGAKRGTTLRLTATGDDAAAAVDTLAATVAGLTE
jgi:phosphotransferase system HPr (HPr) family protein